MQGKTVEKESFRDIYYDTIKGICALNIVVIHTACWSGETYVPNFIRNIVCALDVPMFFFLAGACQQYVKTWKKQGFSLLRLYIKWILFLPIYWAITEYGGGVITGKNMVKNLLFIGGSEQTVLPVVMGSTWFWPIYFIVAFIGSYIIHISKNVIYIFYASCFLYALSLIGWCIFPGNNIIKQELKMSFYMMIFLMGYVSRKFELSTKVTVSIIGALFVICLPHLFYPNSIQMLDAKAPPVLAYCMYSLIGIILVIKLRRPLYQESLLSWIGRKSLYSLFSQGLASSILYKIVAIFNFPWLPKFIVCIFLNIAMTLAITFSLSKYYKLLSKISKDKIWCIYFKGNHEVK